MKHYSLKSQCRLLAILFLLFSSLPSFGQAWVEFVKEKGKESFDIYNYYYYWPYLTLDNGLTYFQLIETVNSSVDRDRDAIPYAIRAADKKIFFYDCEKKTETVAFDFTLSAGDKFTTLNGIEWVVTEACDTTVTLWYGISSKENGRLLKVRSTDGKYTDQWLENYGSFMSRLMMRDISNVEYSHVLFVLFLSQFYNDSGGYVINEFCDDPVYGHCAGEIHGTYGEEETDKIPITLEYDKGELSFTNPIWWYSPSSLYKVFVREGDYIRLKYIFHMEPHYKCPMKWLVDNITLYGLPEPESGSYKIIFQGKEYTTGLRQVVQQEQDFPTTIFDLQGRRMQAVPERGVFIKDGKVMVR